MDPIFHLLPDAPAPVTPYSHAVEAGPLEAVEPLGGQATVTGAGREQDGAVRPGQRPLQALAPLGS